jgi:hypothetical protein
MSSGERFQLSNLAPEYRRAGIVALLLFVCMFLPWYTRDSVGGTQAHPVHSETTLQAFESFSLVEAAILLVAIAVLALLFVRGQKKPFHLPGGDGFVIAASGAWVCALVLYRFIDNKQGDATKVFFTVDYGVTWGIFVTFFVGLLLVHAGLRIRAAHISEPPNPTAADPQRKRSPLKVDDDTNWTDDDPTQVADGGKAVDPLRYDEPGY